MALLSNRRLADALTELQEQADYLDRPPILAVTDAAPGRVRSTASFCSSTPGAARPAQRAIFGEGPRRIIGAVLLDAERDAAMSGYN